jgi:hypothetical protein
MACGMETHRISSQETSTTKAENQPMDYLSSLVYHISKVLRLCHLAQPGRDCHGFTRSIPVRAKSSWCFGTWKLALRHSDEK